MPQVLVLVLGAVGALIAAKLIAKEWRRINDEFDAAGVRTAPVDVERERTNLRRDPQTGVYHPHG